MEMWLHAAAAGVVRAVHVAARETVAAGTVLVELDLDAQDETARARERGPVEGPGSTGIA